MKRVFLLLNVPFSWQSWVKFHVKNLASFVIRLTKWLKCATVSSFVWYTAKGCIKFLFTLVFPHSFPFHSIFQFQLAYQSYPAVPFLTQPVAQDLHISQFELQAFYILFKNVRSHWNFKCNFDRVNIL